MCLFFRQGLTACSLLNWNSPWGPVWPQTLRGLPASASQALAVQGEPPCHAGLDTVKRSTLPGKQAISLVLCYTFCRFSLFSHRTMIETATNDV